VPVHRLGEIIDVGVALRFGHPDSLSAEVREATDYANQLEELRAERLAALDETYADPDLDSQQAYLAAQDQLEVIADITARLTAEESRLAEARERLEGTGGQSDHFYDWLADLG